MIKYKTIFHSKCAQISDTASAEKWFCNRCAGGGNGTNDAMLSDMLQEVRLIRKEQTDIVTSVDVCHEKMDAYTDASKQQHKTLAEYLKIIEDLEEDNASLQKEQLVLQERINEL